MPKLRGLGTTRKGRPIIGLQTLIDRMRPKHADVSLEDAEQAAHVLQRKRGIGARMRDYTLAGSLGKPLVRVMGSMTEHGLEGLKKGPSGVRKGVLKGVAHGFKRTMDLPGTARQAVEGGVGGSLLAGTREALEATRARRVASKFLDEEGQKLSADLRRSTAVLAKKIQPVPTTKLQPIVDSEYDFEV